MVYAFGNYSLDSFTAGFGFIVQAKNIDKPTVTPVTFNIARFEGVLKSGETISARNIDILLKIKASSRADLISRLDALQKALNARMQALCIHEDGRLFQYVDCVSAETKLAGGADVLSCSVPIKFLAYDPYAYASTSSAYDTGTLTLTLASGVWNFPAQDIVGGGNYPSFPLIRVVNKTSTGSTTLTANRNSGTGYTTIAVSATSFSGVIGDKITINNGTTTQTLTVASNFSTSATTITVNSFTANANYISGNTALKETAWTAISVTQTQDSQTLSTNATATVPLPINANEYVDIQCNPVIGLSIQSNGTGVSSDPVGVFPVIESDTTTFNISITSLSKVSAQAIFSWTARYLS